MSRPCGVPSSHALGEHLRHDRRRAHRQRAAQREPGLPAVAQRSAARPSRGDRRDRDLREAEPEHRAAHRAQLRQAELEPDREHQEHDAELGEVARRLRRREPTPSACGPTRDADEQIAEDRRQAHQPADDDDDDRGGEQNRISCSVCEHRAREGERRLARDASAAVARRSRCRRYTARMTLMTRCRSAPRAAPAASRRRARALALARHVLAHRGRRDRALAARLGAPFVAAVELMLDCRGRVVVSRHRQVGPHRAQARRDARVDRHARVLRAPAEAEPRRPRHDHARRRRRDAVEFRRDRRAHAARRRT